MFAKHRRHDTGPVNEYQQRDILGYALKSGPASGLFFHFGSEEMKSNPALLTGYTDISPR